MIAEIQKLLWATTRLRSQLEFQGEADACLKVPHLDEYDSKKAGGGGGGEREVGGGGGAMAARLERSLLLDKLRGLEERVGLFEGLLACDDFFDVTDIDRLVADYIMEGRCSVYRVEVRTGMAMDSTWDSEVYMSLQGDLGITDRELLHNPEYQDQTFPRGSTRFFEIKTVKPVGNLQSITLWLGSTGKSSGWYLEDVVVVDMRLGCASYFACGWMVRQEVALKAEPLEGCYCVYEVVARAPEGDAEMKEQGLQGDDGSKEQGIPDTLELLFGGQLYGHVDEEEEVLVKLDAHALMKDAAEDELAMLRQRQQARQRAALQNGEDAGASGGAGLVEKRWRVRTRYVGNIVRVSVLSMIPNRFYLFIIF